MNRVLGLTHLKNNFKQYSDRLNICMIGSSRSVHIKNRARYMAERGHKVSVITDAITGIEGVEEIIPVSSPDPKLFPLIKAVNCYRSMLRCRPDIVHIHYAHGMGAWMAAFFDHHPLVVSVMGGDILFEEQGRPTHRSRWLTFQLLEGADLIMAKSDYLISILGEIGEFKSKAIKVIWGVDRKIFRHVDSYLLRHELNIPDGDLIILSPRAFEPFYNIHMIVETMPLILKKFPNTKLLLTEQNVDIRYKSQIISRIHTLGLDYSVIFVGNIKNEDMPLYYSLADVVVAVPPSDGLPHSLLEAMACRVPNVISRLPRYKEVVSHEESAYFVDISPEGIAGGVLRILGESALRNRIIENGITIVENLPDLESEIKRVEENYYELMKRPVKRLGLMKRMKILVVIFLHFYIDKSYGTISFPKGILLRIKHCLRRLYSEGQQLLLRSKS
jgi:glycosyltransferase involved in cell wall biosynthesis